MLYENLWILYRNPHYHIIYNWGVTFDAKQEPANTIHSLAAYILVLLNILHVTSR